MREAKIELKKSKRKNYYKILEVRVGEKERVDGTADVGECAHKSVQVLCKYCCRGRVMCGRACVLACLLACMLEWDALTPHPTGVQGC